MVRIQRAMLNASPRSWYEKNPPKRGYVHRLSGRVQGRGIYTCKSTELFISWVRKMVVVVVAAAAAAGVVVEHYYF